MSVKVIQGDCIERLRELPADSVHCVVTSPPYWGLRDYGTGTWDGGDPGCDHQGDPVRTSAGFNERYKGKAFATDKQGEMRREVFRDQCAKCGARRIDQQIGLEPTPEAWAARLVEVFREVRRVLRPDGVCFVNIGDSYAGSWGAQGRNGAHNSPVSANQIVAHPHKASNTGSIPSGSDLKPKDLIGQPWLLAFALRADGWWLRADPIWHKPNPMPESVGGWQWETHRVRGEDGELVECPGCPKCEPNDGLVLSKGSWRPTKAHEYVFMLAKSDCYFCDAEAVREQFTGHPTGPNGYFGAVDAVKTCRDRNDDGKTVGNGNAAGRNLRTVWTIATEPFPEAHFATFPQELARRCILAGTSAKGCCPACGTPWARVVVASYDNPGNRTTNGDRSLENRVQTAGFAVRLERRSETLGWRPTCACDAGEPVPCAVMDPFGGSGTTGVVADQLGRDAILIELSPDYAAMAERRVVTAKAKRMMDNGLGRTKALPGQASLFDAM